MGPPPTVHVGPPHRPQAPGQGRPSAALAPPSAVRPPGRSRPSPAPRERRPGASRCGVPVRGARGRLEACARGRPVPPRPRERSPDTQPVRAETPARQVVSNRRSNCEETDTQRHVPTTEGGWCGRGPYVPSCHNQVPFILLQRASQILSPELLFHFTGHVCSRHMETGRNIPTQTVEGPLLLPSAPFPASQQMS